MSRKVLDHGFVELVESWGSDERIIESARMSTQKGFQGWGPVETRCENCDAEGRESCGANAFAPSGKRRCGKCGGTKVVRAPGDEKLLRFLYENAHATPFEFGGLVIEVQAPIFVFREWHRHRTQSYNEMSARYAPLPAFDYVPTVERCLVGGGANRQAGTVLGAEQLTAEAAEAWRAELEKFYVCAEALYQEGLASGVPKELARLVLPVGRYSKMRASANLRNWLGFLTLRMAPNAQAEIREYANAVGEIVAERFPRTWELFAGGKP
jgi:thymidylate synthase (FAD)